MRISLVVAAAANNAIGKDNQLLWHLPDDLKFFKKTTMGFPIVMGKKTFDSVGRPLPGRRNIVLSRLPDLKIKGAEVFHSLEETLNSLTNEQEIMVVGGAEIYQLFLPKSDRIYLTRVDARPDGDTFFPELNPEEWILSYSEEHPADERHIYAFRFEIWDRRRQV